MLTQRKLKTSEVKEILENIEKYYKCNVDELKELNFYINEKTQKIHVTKVDIEELNIDKISGFGLYFGTMHDNNRLRLSIEGSQLISPKKNYIKINDENLKSYLAGENLFKDEVEEINWEDNAPFLITLHNDENLGSVNIKENMILNYLPKSRRLNFNKVF